MRELKTPVAFDWQSIVTGMSFALLLANCQLRAEETRPVTADVAASPQYVYSSRSELRIKA